MDKPGVLRKRYIPFETVDISGDEMLFRSEELLITRWKAIKPREDISGGISFTFLKKGIKISRFYNASGEFLYWYCDIIDVEYDPGKDLFTLVDLLIDVKILPGGCPRILDADELAEAIEKDLITKEQACSSLKKLDLLLKMIYSGNFPPEVCKSEEYTNIK